MNTKRILRLAGWLVVLLGGYAGGVLALSALVVTEYDQATPAFLLWRIHAFPYVKQYVSAGMHRKGHLVAKEFRGKTFEAVQRRFGHDFVLEREYGGTWPNPSPTGEHKVRIYRLANSPVLCVMQDEECVELDYFKGT